MDTIGTCSMKSLTGKELCKILEENGWILKRIQGSHHLYKKEWKFEIISAPVHANKHLKFRTQSNILKQADIKI